MELSWNDFPVRRVKRLVIGFKKSLTILLIWLTFFVVEMEGGSKEAQLYGDIVQADYQEHFWNMSYKVAMGFEWSVKYCTFEYLLKADDDVFVNTLGLMDFLSKYTTPRRKFYTGNIMTESEVLRNGRYAVSPEEYNETVYKPYFSGGSYVLSSGVVEMFLLYFDVLKPLKIDNAYIGLLADRACVNVTHNEDFRMFENKCEYKESTLVQHPTTGNCAIKLYHNMFGLVARIHKWIQLSTDWFILMGIDFDKRIEKQKQIYCINTNETPGELA